MADRWEGSDKESFLDGEQARWAYNGVIFEVKKEIPG
jgi:hypothetical protein